jgi:uncharacterized protein YigA (DUF484 family)
MGSVHSLDEMSLARLRERLGEAEAAREDLLAFARGHSGAVASIHRAVLLALDAVNFQHLATIVTADWPAALGIDAVSLLIVSPDGGMIVNSDGAGPIAPALVGRMLDDLTRVSMRSVERGHPCFGPSGRHIRGEARIRFDRDGSPVKGVLLLGQTRSLPAHSRQGGELLQFLGRSLGAMIERWMTEAID